MKRALAIVAAVGLSPMLAQAQDPKQAESPSIGSPGESGKTPVIRGVVLDISTTRPIAGASITVAGTAVRAATRRDGHYAIEGLRPGTYEVLVEAPGYEAATLPIEVSSDKVASGDILLPKAGSVAEEVVVTASRNPEKLLDAPVTVESVNETQIATTGGSSYLSALSGVKGIDFSNTGINEQRISARGFTTQFNSRMLSMVDGRIAALPGHGLPQNNLLPATTLDMRAIEVVVGPASALYGPNAHDGVINVATKSPWDESGVSASLRGGSQNLADGALRLAGTVTDHVGWKVNGQ